MTRPNVALRDPGLGAVVRRHLPELALSDSVLKTALPGMAKGFGGVGAGCGCRSRSGHGAPDLPRRCA